MHAFIVSLLLIFLALYIHSHQAEQIPCHSNRRSSGDGSNCDVAVIPFNLCKTCKLRPFLKKGNFQSCSKIFNLTPLSCRNALRTYARLNPCDAVRNRQVKDFSNNQNLVGLDYFIYSVCEECCDCVPRGTKPGQYDARKKAGTLVKVDRANCGTHAHFDVCKVLPKIRYVKNPGQATPKNYKKFWPPICPIIRKWKESNTKLFNKDEVAIPPPMRKFLTRYSFVAQCRNKDLWNECVALEFAQRRI